MKKNFWLILAVVSLLGLIIMPGMAKAAVIGVPTTLPNIAAPRVVLPNYPVLPAGIRPQIQLPSPQIGVSVVATALPSLSVEAPAVQASAVLAPVVAQTPVKVVVPRSAIPASRIQGVAVTPKAGRKPLPILSRMAEAGKGSRLAAPAKLAALFDGAAKTEPVPVPVEPEPAPQQQDDSEELRLTLPESDLAEEIGIGY